MVVFPLGMLFLFQNQILAARGEHPPFATSLNTTFGYISTQSFVVLTVLKNRFWRSACPGITLCCLVTRKIARFSTLAIQLISEYKLSLESADSG